MSDADNADWLWWAMLTTGVAAAIISIVTGAFDRRRVDWPNARQRQLLHIVSYGFMTLSILAFVLRGLIAPA
ncbi:MAG: hypothetical protein WBF58_19335 [Xanthobacteraceae bacterium]